MRRRRPDSRSVRRLLNQHFHAWQDCAHVLSTLPEEDPDASLVEAIRAFLAEGPDRTPHVIALSCAVLMQSMGDPDAVFARIQSGVMATLVDAEDVVVRPVAA